jgi:hypothetical protein
MLLKDKVAVTYDAGGVFVLVDSPLSRRRRHP